MRVLLAAILVLVAVVVSVARAADATVNTSGTSWSPNSVTITVGEKVTWNNPSSLSHNVRIAGEDAALVAIGGNWSGVSKTFSSQGTYTFYCEVHSFDQGQTGMRGTVTVLPEGQPSPTPDPTPSTTATATATATATGTANPSATPTASATTDPSATPTPSPTATTGPPVPGPHTTTVKAKRLATLPDCVPGRKLRVRLKSPAGAKSARVLVDGDVARRVKELPASVVLRHLPRRFTLRVDTTLINGDKLTASRTLRRCPRP